MPANSRLDLIQRLKG